MTALLLFGEANPLFNILGMYKRIHFDSIINFIYTETTNELHRGAINGPKN